MTDSLINKILHDPIIFLKKNGHENKKTAYLDMTRNLFKLDNNTNNKLNNKLNN